MDTISPPTAEQITEAELDRQDEIRWAAYSIANVIVQRLTATLPGVTCGMVGIEFHKRIWTEVYFFSPTDQRAAVERAISIATPEIVALMQRLVGEWCAILSPRHEAWRAPADPERTQ